MPTGCACGGGGGFDKISRTVSTALRRTLGRGSMVCSTMVLNALRRAGASSGWEGIEGGDKNTKNCDKGPEGRSVRICMREKGYEDGEDSGGQGSEEGRRDEWDDNGVADLKQMTQCETGWGLTDPVTNQSRCVMV